MGKSSLVKEAFRQSQDSSGILTVYVDFLQKYTIGSITGAIIQPVAVKVEHVLDYIKKSLSGISVTLKGTNIDSISRVKKNYWSMC